MAPNDREGVAVEEAKRDAVLRPTAFLIGRSLMLSLTAVAGWAGVAPNKLPVGLDALLPPKRLLAGAGCAGVDEKSVEAAGFDSSASAERLGAGLLKSEEAEVPTLAAGSTIDLKRLLADAVAGVSDFGAPPNRVEDWNTDGVAAEPVPGALLPNKGVVAAAGVSEPFSAASAGFSVVFA